MGEHKQMTTEDVLEALRKRRPLCDRVAVENPVTGDEVLAAFEAKMTQRQDLGVVKRVLNLLLEPRNSFEPQRTRKPRTETILFGILFAVIVAAFLFFNLAAPRLQVHR
jgi:hypothetical protein